MKASTLVLMLLIGMISFTGFGQTTSDLTKNSNADIVQMDESVNVVIIADQSIHVDDSIESFSLEESITEKSFNVLFSEEANPALNLIYQNQIYELLDVGWPLLQLNALALKIKGDAGGVLSLFYT